MSSPTPRSRSTIRTVPLSAAIGLSLLIHAGLGLAVGLEASRSNSDIADSRFERFNTSDEADQPPVVQLGDPDSRAASLTWIGYREFEELWAPKSEIDQAQQVPGEAGSPSEIPTPAPEQTTPKVLAEDQADEPSEPAEDSEPLAAPAPEAADTVELAGEDPQIDPARLVEMLEAIEDLASDLPRLNPIPGLLERAARRQADRDAAPDLPEPGSGETSDARAENGPSRPETQPGGESGQNAEREADAAAVNPIRNDELGKPLVAQGLSIRTVRPSFSNVTLATARPRNPVVRIDFRRNGKPIRVSIIRSSGHDQVDIDIRKALYSWRAEGDVLQELPDPEDPNNPAYISIKLEILL